LPWHRVYFQPTFGRTPNQELTIDLCVWPWTGFSIFLLRYRHRNERSTGRIRNRGAHGSCFPSAVLQLALLQWLIWATQGMLMLEAVHHVAVICSDYERSKHFYSEILGLLVVRGVWRSERQSSECDLQVGVAQIELLSFPSPPARPSRPEACGLRHLAFSVAALKPVITRLKSLKVAVELIRTKEYRGKRFVLFCQSRWSEGSDVLSAQHPPDAGGQRQALNGTRTDDITLLPASAFTLSGVWFGRTGLQRRLTSPPR
jgi:glyoxylase I family protein